MAKRLALITITTVIAACSSDLQQARQLVADSLLLKADLEFHDLRSYPGDVVCGEFSATTSFTRPRVEHQPFIVVYGQLDKSPSTSDQKIFCSDDPATALLEMTGIGPITTESHDIGKVVRDFTVLAAALESYYEDNHYYPTEAQGLAALATQPEGALPRYREGGYLKEIPFDPWNRPYRYTEEQWGRTKGQYEIKTFGRSGTPGGGGAENDISSNNLTYLQHVTRVAGLD